MTKELRITKRFYDWCVLNKEPVPRIVRQNKKYYWIDIKDADKMDSLLLWADCLYWQSSDRKVKASAGAIKKAYNNQRASFDNVIYI